MATILTKVISELRELAHQSQREEIRPAVLAMRLESIANKIEDSNDYEILEQMVDAADDGPDEEPVLDEPDPAWFDYKN